MTEYALFNLRNPGPEVGRIRVENGLVVDPPASLVFNVPLRQRARGVSLARLIAENRDLGYQEIPEPVGVAAAGATATPSLKRLVSSAPTNAWLLIGDEASYPTAEELRDSRLRWREECFWTGPRQAQPGDLLFFYFMAPRKAIHFLARAGSHPVFDPTIEVNALRDVDPNQWWLNHTPLVEVKPLPFRDLQAALGGHLNLRGKPSHYIPPDAAHELLQHTTPLVSTSARDRAVLQVPVGDPELPDPAHVTRTAWACIADGPLKLERQVEHYIVEPLLRLALPRTGAVTWQKSYRIKGGVPDYVVLRDGTPSGVVEVKIGVREPRKARWGDSPDFQQVMRYSATLGVPAALVDSNRIFLFAAGASRPVATIHRRSATEDDLKRVGEHLSARSV